MRALSCSQGSRTSSNSGASRLLSASHAASSAGLICLINSELESRKTFGVDERPDHRLEKDRGAVLARPGAGDEASAHRRRFADYREQPPLGRELREQRGG